MSTDDSPASTDDSPGGTVDAVLDRVGHNDALIVGASIAFVYLLFALFVVIGQGLSTDAINPIVSQWRGLTYLFAAYAMLALALNLHWGYTGLFNIGVAGFMAVGVYTMALLSTPPDAVSGAGLGLPLPIGVIGGMIAAALVGLIAALPALRLRADYLAIVTLGLSEIIRLTLNSRTLSDWTEERIGFATGGGSGMDLPARPTDAFFQTDAGAAVIELLDPFVRRSVIVPSAWVLFMLVFVALFYWLLVRIGYSPFGRVLKAIRGDELVAQSLGKDTRMFKIKVFMLGCALMGLAGILWQGSQGYVAPNSFRPIVTFYVFIALIIGGSGSNTGSVVGAVLFVGLLFEGPRRVGGAIDSVFDLGVAPNTFADAVGPLTSLDPMPFLAYVVGNIAALQFVLLGVVLIYIMQTRPEGVLGHRMETAASVNLDRPERATAGEAEPVAADGGER